MYQLEQCGVRNLSTGAFIPEDLSNYDWQVYLQWLNKGNTPKAYSNTFELEMQKNAIQKQIDVLEQKQSRALREFVLDANNKTAKQKLKDIDDQIKVLSVEL